MFRIIIDKACRTTFFAAILWRRRASKSEEAARI